MLFLENLQFRCLFHRSTASSPGVFPGALHSSVASEAGLEPGAPRGGHWGRTYETLDRQQEARRCLCYHVTTRGWSTPLPQWHPIHRRTATILAAGGMEGVKCQRRCLHEVDTLIRAPYSLTHCMTMYQTIHPARYVSALSWGAYPRTRAAYARSHKCQVLPETP